ncbi:MAG TPA: ROK family protein [Bryobacteraceae bacterium]|nr:ROK family protein [Bryobacteraceae bacterium]
MNSVFAVDLGGTKTACATVDESGAIRSRTKEPAEHSPEAAVRRIAGDAARTGADAVGVIVPGIYNRQTGMAWAPNLWGWDEVPLGDMLAAQLSIPVVIDSDRSGYVVGEQWLGAARGLADVVFVGVGTGIGVGILSAGRLVKGAHGIAGAAGWFALDPRWKSEYAQMGCWEAESAGPAVARRAGTSTAEAAVAAARRGDPLARAALDHAADYLAMGIANLISLLNPEMIVLGGGLMQAADLLLGHIREGVSRWAQPIAVTKVKIEVTTLGEDAGLLGAARLALLPRG